MTKINSMDWLSRVALRHEPEMLHLSNLQDLQLCFFPMFSIPRGWDLGQKYQNPAAPPSNTRPERPEQQALLWRNVGGSAVCERKELHKEKVKKKVKKYFLIFLFAFSKDTEEKRSRGKNPLEALGNGAFFMRARKCMTL